MIEGLPEKLLALRKRYGYSQRQVAEKLGVSPAIISAYETGERTPSTENLLALSYLYNCETDYLLGRKAASAKTTLDLNGLTSRQINALHHLIEAFKN